MNIQGSALIAFRFLRSSTREKNIAVMLKICFLSILIATFALTLVAAIMNGFEKATYAKLQGIHPDLTISAQDKPLNYEKLKTVFNQEFEKSIEAFSPASFSQVIIQNNRIEANDTQIGLLKAVDQLTEPRVSNLTKQILKENVTEPLDPWSRLNGSTIFIGQALADRLQIKTGSPVTLLYPHDEIINNKVTLEAKEATVGAIFKTGINDFDEHVIIASFEFVNSLHGDKKNKVTQIALKLKDPTEETAVIAMLKKRLNLDVTAWKELYPPLMSALTLEKYAMLFILALVTLVASMTILALLFMYTTQKRIDIALLKTMGMSDYALMNIFLIISLTITLGATVCGIGLAAVATWVLNKYPFIPLPDIYYVAHLPATLDARIVISVLLFALFVALFAALIPARTIRSLRIADILKGIPL